MKFSGDVGGEGSVDRLYWIGLRSYGECAANGLYRLVWTGLKSYDEYEVGNGNVLHWLGVRSDEAELLIKSELEALDVRSEDLLSGGVRRSNGTEVRSGKLTFGNLGVVGS